MLKTLGTMLFMMCFVAETYATPMRTTKIVLVKNGHASSMEVSPNGLLQVKADSSQNGPTPGTTVLMGHVTLTTQRKQGSLTLTADQATVESELIEVQVAPISDPVIDIGSDIRSLAPALKLFPSATAFRVTWNFSGLGASVNASELYQRQEQTFSLYSISGDESGSITTREFYTNVQDSAIHQVAAQPGGTSVDLTDFGAIKHAPQHTSKTR